MKPIRENIFRYHKGQPSYWYFGSLSKCFRSRFKQGLGLRAEGLLRGSLGLPTDCGTFLYENEGFI